MLKLAPILEEIPEDIGMSGHEGCGGHDRKLHQALPFHGGGGIGPESITRKSEMANHNSRGIDTATVILGVLADRHKATVKVLLSRMPQKLRKTMKAVCSAIYDGFISAAKEILGKKVKIVIERFHVAKFYRKGWDTLRKQELRRLKKENLRFAHF